VNGWICSLQSNPHGQVPQYGGQLMASATLAPNSSPRERDNPWDSGPERTSQ
jgi:hypothetical protein